MALAQAPAVDDLEAHRRGLTGYCYRMLGSGSEAEDAVQETLLRAWRHKGDLAEPAALKSWLFRIASNVCLDMLASPQRRARPLDLAPPGRPDGPLGEPLGDQLWVQPVPDDLVLAPDGDPAAQAQARESLRLAFIAALQHLPPRQRAVLVLCEVLRWKASEAAELLDTTTASVNSALQRARATLAELDLAAEDVGADAEDDALLARYVDAFERYDMSALTALLREDATFTMPPFPLWVRGVPDIVAFMTGTGAKCEGSKVVPVAANGGPAAAVYNPVGDGTYAGWCVVVLERSGGRITGLHHFIGPQHFKLFGLPERLEA